MASQANSTEPQGSAPAPASRATKGIKGNRTAPVSARSITDSAGKDIKGTRALANKQSQAGPTVAAKDVAKWDKVQAQLKAKLGPDVYASWFGRCRLESVSKSQLVLSVPTTFLKSWIKTH